MKVHSLEVLAMIVHELRADGSRIVHCHGCFDLPHVGHVKHLQAAKRMGDVLVVTVTPDEFVGKGEGRPLFGQRHRVEALAGLECVDYVAINLLMNRVGDAQVFRPLATAEWAIKKLHPHLYVKGPECLAAQSAGLLAEIEAVEAVGGRFACTEGEVFSSTKLIDRLRGGPA